MIERVGENSTPPEHELLHTPETDSEIEFEQLLPTPDMSPIIRSKTPPMESISHFPLSETKLSVVLDKTQDIILGLYNQLYRNYFIVRGVILKQRKLHE